ATETVARRARYAWLGEVQRRHGAADLVTAHHRDDQVGTILLRLLKGSAPAGLAGIPARGRGGLVRPLLPFPKTRLVAHVTELGLPIHDDPANRDPRHLRSWVRTVLLPLVGERLGARVGHDVLRAGRAAARERRAWDGVLDHLPDLGLRIEPHRIEVARGGLAHYDDVLSAALLRAAARRSGLVLGVRRARQLVELTRRPSGRRLPLGDGWMVPSTASLKQTGGRELKRIVFDEETIARRVRELGQEITAAYPDGELLVLGLLKGSFIFLSDLVRRIERPLQVDFLVAASYG